MTQSPARDKLRSRAFVSPDFMNGGIGMNRFAQVLVDINCTSLDRVFDYLLPEGMDIAPGQHVLVPFGGGKKPVAGFVLGLSDVSGYDPARLKSIVRPLEQMCIRDSPLGS